MVRRIIIYQLLLSSIPIYAIQLVDLPKGVCEEIKEFAKDLYRG